MLLVVSILAVLFVAVVLARMVARADRPRP